MGLLRLFLALSVVIHHLPEHSFAWLNAGVAVLVFFMISGFYMALVINEKYSKADSWQWRFYLSRLGRLFTAYLAVLLFGILWQASHSPPTVFTTNFQLGYWKQTCLILSNLFILGQDLFQTVLMTSADNKHNFLSDFGLSLFGAKFFQNDFMIVGQAWSIGMELIFYILAPYFVLRIRNILIVLTLSIIVRVFFQWQSSSFPPLVWGYWFFPSTISFFCLGCLGYFLFKKISCFRWAKMVGFVLYGILLTWFVLSLKKGGILYEGSSYDSLSHWIFYLCMATCIPFIFLITKNSYFDRLLGELSYPLYLVHGFVIGILFAVGAMPRGSLLSEVIIIVCAVGVSGLIYIFIDGPVDHYRKKIETAALKPMYKWAAAIFVSILAIGLIVGIRVQSLAPFTSKTQEQSATMLPFLVKVVGKFNIVSFNKQFFAIPIGLSIDWDKDVSKLPGVLTAGSQNELLMMLPR